MREILFYGMLFRHLMIQGTVDLLHIFVAVLKEITIHYFQCVIVKKNPGCFVQSYEQINSNSEYEEDGNRLGNSEFSVECEDYSMIEMKMLLDRLELSENERVVVKSLLMEKSKPDIAGELGVKNTICTYLCKTYWKKLIAAGLLCIKGDQAMNRATEDHKIWLFDLAHGNLTELEIVKRIY